MIRYTLGLVPVATIGIGLMVQNDWPLMGTAANTDEQIYPWRQETRPEKGAKTTLDNVTETITSYRYQPKISNREYTNSTIKLDGYRGIYWYLQFTGSEIAGRLVKSEAINCQFHNCTLNEIMMDKQGFDSCDFTGSTINKINSYRFGGESSAIYNCNFQDTVWTDGRIEREQGYGRFDQCNFQGAHFRDMRMDGVILRDSTFDGTKFENTHVGDIIRCSFKGADVSGLTIHGGMSPWTYIYMWWNGADVSAVKLW